MHGFSLSLSYSSVASEEGVRRLVGRRQGDDAEAPTFWVEAFGMLVDRFGTAWMFNAGKPAQMGCGPGTRFPPAAPQSATAGLFT